MKISNNNYIITKLKTLLKEPQVKIQVIGELLKILEDELEFSPTDINNLLILLDDISVKGIKETLLMSQFMQEMINLANGGEEDGKETNDNEVT